MIYKTATDLRRRFTEDTFNNIINEREVSIENSMKNWKEQMNRRFPIVNMIGNAPIKTKLVTNHWLISYSNEEVTMVTASDSTVGYDDKAFDAICKNRNKEGYTSINAMHATVRIPE